MKRTGFIVLLLSAIIISADADHIPSTGSLDLEYQSRIALIGSINNWNPYVEFLGNVNNDTFQLGYRHFLAGTYYRIHRNLKIGAFYLLQEGTRHDDDWIALNPGWKWDDSTERLENTAILDLSPRFILPKILNEKSLASIKIRYQYNFFNNQQSLIFKPALSYFYLSDRKPVWNTSLAYSLYFPINFSEAVLYEHGLYLNFIYHVNKWFKLETRASLLFKNWTTGADSKALGDSYSVIEKNFNIGFGIILTP